jgi:CRP/FNR family transcriptional regulator, cyclic AMP receptor protein
LDEAVEWPLLAPLTDGERAAVLARARRRTFAKGEVVFHEGDPADALHLVESGHLAVRVSTPDGERATLTILSAGDAVGELALLDRGTLHHRSASVLALDKAETRVLSASSFHELCDQHPGVQRLLVDTLAGRVRDLSGRLLETMYLGLDRRVYRCLLRLAEVYGEGTARPVIPLTQEHLADLVGGTRPSVNQVLQRLVTLGVIELGRGRVVIVNQVELTRRAGL